MSEENGKCKCGGRCKCRLVVWMLVAIVLVAVVAGVVAQRRAAEQAARAAEAARVEAVLQKPLLEWTEDARAEFADAFETRRQVERANDKRLWTADEKKREWWSYFKLVVRQSCHDIQAKFTRR